MSTFTIELPDALQKSIEEIAAREGYTANQFLAAAASEKLAAVITVNYLREEAALRKETVTGMNSIRAGFLSRLDNLFRHQITFAWGRWADEYSLVRVTHM